MPTHLTKSIDIMDPRTVSIVASPSDFSEEETIGWIKSDIHENAVRIRFSELEELEESGTSELCLARFEDWEEMKPLPLPTGCSPNLQDCTQHTKNTGQLPPPDLFRPQYPNFGDVVQALQDQSELLYETSKMHSSLEPHLLWKTEMRLFMIDKPDSNRLISRYAKELVFCLTRKSSETSGVDTVLRATIDPVLEEGCRSLQIRTMEEDKAEAREKGYFNLAYPAESDESRRGNLDGLALIKET